MRKPVDEQNVLIIMKMETFRAIPMKCGIDAEGK